jgi:hypothetical protein
MFSIEQSLRRKNPAVIITLKYEELRPLVFEVLKSSDSENQVIMLIDAVQRLFFEKGFDRDDNQYQMVSERGKRLLDKDRERIRHLISELVTEGILSWGADEMHSGPPYLSITEYGQIAIQNSTPQPYDPEGYLAYLKSQVGSLDSIIELYIVEATQTFRRNNLLSAAVMTGVASERAFDMLLDAVAKAITGPGKQKKFEDLKTYTSTKTKFDEVKKVIMQNRSKLPQEIDETLESDLDGIFTLIRIARNDSGHPTGKIMRREQVYVNLQLFVQYCRCVYRLIDYLNKNVL